MTEVNPNNTSCVQSPLSQFRFGYAPDSQQMLGLEAEFFVTRHGGVAKTSVLNELSAKLARQGYQASLEFDGIIEYAGKPYPVAELKPMAQQGLKAYDDFSKATRGMGFALADTSHIATHTMAEAEANVAPRERALAGLKSMQMHAPVDCRLLPLMNASVQVSLNVRNRDEMFQTAEMAYLLTPFIYAAFANHPSQFNGQDCSTYHPRGKLYEAYGVAGGIAPAFQNAASARDFERLHVEDLKRTPLFFTSNQEGHVVVPDKGLPIFGGLPKELQTVSNFQLAQSFNYHDAKVCNIYSGRDIVGKRVEVRAFDTGYENMQIAPIFCALTMRNAEVGKVVRDLLTDYGFTGTPKDYAPLLVKSRHDAVYHGGRYMDVPFGRHASGKEGRMLHFAYELGGILEQAVSCENNMVKSALDPLLDRCETGVNQAQKLARPARPVYVQVA